MSTSPDNSKKANDGGPTIPDSSPFSGGPVGGMMTPSALSGSAAAVSEKSEKPAYVSAGTSQQSVQGVSSSSVMSQVEHMKTPAPLILKLPMLRMRVASSMPGPILSEPPAGREKSTMQINIETLTGRSIPLTCESNELVSKVKEIIWDKDKTGGALPDSALLFKGKRLADEWKLDELGVKPGETLHMVLQLRMRVASSMSGPILSEPREKIGELTHDDVFQKSHANVSGTEKVSSGAVTAESSTSATLLSGSEHDDEERKHSTFIYSNIEADVDCCAKCYLNLTEKGILALLSGRGGESAEGRTLTHMSVFQREELKKLNGGEEEEILSPIQCDICSKALMPL